jgi:aspartyl-tRNA(Asn)/glutamyl-tRNA(Gln) amidotransferase subunit A
MKGTFGRIPRGPHAFMRPNTVVLGNLARSVRDAARWYDVCSGHDKRDPYSLPKVEGWERDLGTNLDAVRGKKVVIAPTLGSEVVRPEEEQRVRAAGEALAADAGLVVVEVPVALPGLGLEWAITNLATLLADLGDRWPSCKDDLTGEIAFGLEFATQVMNLETAASAERARTAANEAMAAIFDEVDFVIAATNPDTAYPAEVMLNTKVGDVKVGPENNGALTIPANIVGNPAVSIPIEPLDRLPVGMQVIAPHHHDALLLDLALLVERNRPWPLVATG